MKRYSVLAGLVALSVALAACTPASAPVIPPAATVLVTQIVAGTPVVVTATPEPAVPTAAGAVTVVRVGTGDSGEGLNPHQQIIQEFEDENSGLLIQLEAVAGRDYYTRLLMQLAAKAAPDIMQVGDDAVPMFVGKGAFLPLDDMMAAQGFDPNIYLPGVLEPGQWEGKQYLLPKDYTPLAVYYNKKIFDAAGVPYPQEGWTWEDLLDTALKLTRDDNNDGTPEVYGLQLTANWTTGFEYWVAAAGGRLISPDGTQFTGYMDSPETVRAVQFYRDLYHDAKVAPPPTDLNQWAGGNQEFDNGQAAMYLFGHWRQASFLKNPNIELGVAPPPQDKARANVLFWGGFGVASTSQSPEQAFRFLSFYTGQPGAETWKDWGLPAVASVAEEARLTTDPIEGVWLNELNHLVPRAYTFTPYWNETADPALRKALETVILDPEADVEAVMAAAAQEAQAALDKVR